MGRRSSLKSRSSWPNIDRIWFAVGVGLPFIDSDRMSCPNMVGS